MSSSRSITSGRHGAARRRKPGVCVLAAAIALAAATASIADAARPYAVWVADEGERNGHPVVIRRLDPMPADSVHAEYPWCAVIAWHLRANGQGEPAAGEAERALDFETTLEQRLARPGLATEVLRVSDGNLREWTYYAADRERIVAALDALRREDPGAPVTYEVKSDRDWQVLFETLSTIKP